MNSSFIIRVSDVQPAEAPTTPPTPTGLVSASLPRGAMFTWGLNTNIRPFWWQYRVRVAQQGWSGWIDTIFPIVIRTLTTAEISEFGVDATIEIEVRSTNGSEYSQTVSTSGDASSLYVTTDDITDSSIYPISLSEDVLARMFTSAERSAADLQDGSIQTAKLANSVTSRMFEDETRTANDTTHVGGETVGNVLTWAQNGNAAKAKIDADVGAETIETTTGAAAKVDSRLSATEKTNLNTALGVTLAELSVTDRIGIIAGTHENFTANASTIKTKLSLNNVENKSSAQIRAEITDDDLSGTTALLEGAWASFIANANQNNTIPSSAITSIRADKLVDNTDTALFDQSGNLTFHGSTSIGVKSGDTIRTASNITSAIDSLGRSVNLKFDSPAQGQTLDNVPNGSTYVKTSVNEKTGASRAYLGLNDSGKLMTGTPNYTTTEIETSVEVPRTLFMGTEEYNPTPGGINTEVNIISIPIVKEKTDTSVIVRALCKSEDMLGIFGAELLNEVGAPMNPPVKAETVVSSATYAPFSVSLQTSTYENGTWLQVRVYIKETELKQIYVKQIKLRST